MGRGSKSAQSDFGENSGPVPVLRGCEGESDRADTRRGNLIRLRPGSQHGRRKRWRESYPLHAVDDIMSHMA